MAGNSFEKKLRIVVEGIEKSITDLNQFGTASEEGQQAIDNLNKEVTDLAKNLDQAGEAGARGGRKMSEGLQEIQKAANEAEKALRKLIEADLKQGGMGDPSKLVGQLGPDQTQAAEQWKNYSTSNVVSANEKAKKSSEQLAAAIGRVSEALGKQQFEESIEGLSSLEQAQARYNRALREQMEAGVAAGQARGTDGEVKAQQNLAKAIDQTSQARSRLNAEETKAAGKHEKEVLADVEKLTKSEERLAQAREAARKAIPQAEEDRISIARRNLEEANESLRASEENLAQVQADSTSTVNEVAQAQNQAAEAVTEQSRAYGALEKEAETAINTLPRLRYALYDVSRTLTQLGAGMLGAATSVGVVSTKMTADFAEVIRTTEAFRDATGQTASAMRKDFEDLYSSMPADWADVTRIGEMAGQMNIAANDVAHFTETVTKFAASTDVSVDSSATAFGRLSELLNVSADEYENLGSSILSVGVNSVATENQIIEISQQIAGIAGTAGLTADEVVGLSSALASIGTAPELSRGIVTRFFTNLMEATSEGGERLEKFAAVSQMSAAEFQQAWATDAAGAFQAVIQGLGQVEESEAINVLKELGIQQVRDIPAVLKLAQNYELLGHSMDIAATGYSEGAALSEHYGVVSETTAAKVQVFKNQLALLMDAMGQFTQTDFFKGLIDGATRALELMTSLADTSVGKVLIGLGTAIAGLTGAVALLTASFVALVASSKGLRTATVNLATGMKVARSAADMEKMSLWQLLGAMKATEAGAKSLRIALSSIGVGLVISALSLGVAKVTEEIQGASSAIASFAGLEEAIRADTQAFREAEEAGRDVSESYRLIKFAGEEGAEGTGGLSDSMMDILGISRDVTQGMSDLADETDRATIALGDNFKMAVAENIATNEDLLDLLQETDEVLAQVGFTAADFAEALVSPEGAGSYLDRMVQSVKDYTAAQQDAYYAQEVGKVTSEELGAGLKGIEEDGNAAISTLESFRDIMTETEGEISRTALQTEVLGAVSEALGIDMEVLEEQFDATGESAEGFRTLLSDFDSTAYDLQGTFYDLADAIIQNGGAFDEFSVEGRNSMAALTSAMDDLWDSADGDAQVFAMNLAEAFAYVEGAGYNLIDSIDVMDQALDAAFGTEWRAHLDTTQAHQSIRDYIRAVIAALEARAQLERESLAQSQSMGLDNWAVGSGIDYRSDISKQHQDNINLINQQIASMKGLENSLGSAGAAGQQAGRRIHDSLSPKGSGRSAGRGAKEAQKAAKELKEEMYTLGDYASDLASIWDRAFEIRFSGQQTIDSVTSSIRGMADRFEDAENRVRDLKIQLQTLRGDLTGLEAELSKQQYHLSIAMEYGDSKRAEQIQARIAELQAELAEKQRDVADTSKEVKKAQDDTSRSLEGNSDAAIRNRADLMSLLSEYQDHIKALANSGMGSKELQRETDRLRKDFIKQATQLGFNKRELDRYTQGFRDVKRAIDVVPRKITVRASMSPAQQAVNEWIARVNQRKATMTVRAKVQKPRSLGTMRGGQYQPSSIYSRGQLSTPSIVNRGGLTTYGPIKGYGIVDLWQARPYSTGGQATSSGPIYRADGGPAEWGKMFAKGTDTLPAMLTPGEYIIQKQAVDFYGPEVMRAINNMQVPKRFFTSSGQMQGGQGASGMGSNGQRVTVDLSPSSVQAVAHAVQPILRLDNKSIAQANGASNRRASSTGAL